MLKKSISRLLLLFATVLFAFPSLSQTFESGGIYYYIASDGKNSTCAVVTYDENKFYQQEGSYKGNLVIPKTVKKDGKTYAVRNINQQAFFYCKDLKSINIPASVDRTIYPYLAHCVNLEKIEVDNDNPSYYSTGKELLSKDKKTLYNVAPAAISGEYSIPDGVEYLSPYCFISLKNLTSVHFPKTFMNLNGYMYNNFFDCEHLISFSVDAANPVYKTINGMLCKEVDGTLSLVKLPSGIEGKVTIPSEIKTIDNGAIYSCNKITELNIGDIESMGNMGFCESLKTINVKNVKDIPVPGISYCPKLENFNIDSSCENYASIDGIVYNKALTELVMVPCGRSGEFIVNDNVTSVGAYAFNNCVNLTSIELPESVTEWGRNEYITDSKRLTLIIRGTLNGYSYLGSLNANMVIIICKESEISNVKKYFTGDVYSFDMPYYVKELTTYLQGVTFTVEKNKYATNASDIPLKVTLSGNGVHEEELTPDTNGLYKRFGLKDNYTYTLRLPHYIQGERDYKNFTTQSINSSFKTESTQTTITVKSLSFSKDESCSYDRVGFTFQGKTYSLTGKPIVITDLNPATRYSFQTFAYFNGEQRFFDEYRSTIGLNPSIKTSNIGPTSFVAVGSYVRGDAKIKSANFRTPSASGTEVFNGMEPNTTYTIYFDVECENGYKASAKATVKTPALTLVTEQPKCVSPKCAIVAASTNMTSDEVNAGFQWKKYDAPSSLKPSEGNAAIYEGQLEGYIKNLQSTSYYNVRAFYKSNSGKYYYGEWITFDPSDFSFFEPTVHTYATTSVSHNTASVSAYVMAGTDDITRLGFEYWAVGSQKRMTALAPVADDEVMTVLSTGQIMKATLENLIPETDYCYRAFVTTEAGTKYGEEQTFTTDYDSAGIDNVIVDGNDARTPVVYYDMCGRRYKAPQRGFNIVVYSDGSSEKILMK